MVNLSKLKIGQSVVAYSKTDVFCKIHGIDPEFYNDSLPKQLEAKNKIKEWIKTAKKDWVNSKGKPGSAAVKEWIKLNKPSEYFAEFEESQHYKDDSIEIHYK